MKLNAEVKTMLIRNDVVSRVNAVRLVKYFNDMKDIPTSNTETTVYTGTSVYVYVALFCLYNICPPDCPLDNHSGPANRSNTAGF